MNNNLVFLVEMVLIFGLVLAFAVWELVKLRNEQKADAARDAEKSDAQD